MAPYFVTTPTNTTAPLHASVRLDCKAYGVPTPTLKWMKYTDSGETVITTSGRFIVSALSGYLYILGIHWSDAGRYGCIAQNEHGRIVADAHVTVVTGTCIPQSLDFLDLWSFRFQHRSKGDAVT